MKKLVVILALIGLAGAGRPVKIARSPKDMATGATNRPVVVAPAPTLTPSRLMPSLQALVQVTNRPPYTNVPQLPRDWGGFWWVASNTPGVKGYLVLWSDDLTNKLGYTNVLDRQLPDGKAHTNYYKFDKTVKARWFALFEY